MFSIWDEVCVNILIVIWFEIWIMGVRSFVFWGFYVFVYYYFGYGVVFVRFGLVYVVVFIFFVYEC